MLGGAAHWRGFTSDANAPPVVENGIREARDAIRRVKNTLRAWNIAVADHPDDEKTSTPS